MATSPILLNLFLYLSEVLHIFLHSSFGDFFFLIFSFGLFKFTEFELNCFGQRYMLNNLNVWKFAQGFFVAYFYVKYSHMINVFFHVHLRERECWSRNVALRLRCMRLTLERLGMDSQLQLLVSAAF